MVQHCLHTLSCARLVEPQYRLNVSDGRRIIFKAAQNPSESSCRFGLNIYDVPSHSEVSSGPLAERREGGVSWGRHRHPSSNQEQWADFKGDDPLIATKRCRLTLALAPRD